MAQTGFTPILIYASGTATNVPLAADLTSSAYGAELALNFADGKLYYKDSGGTVQLLASKDASSTTISFGTTGLTPNTASTGAITVAGTLITSNGGTGLSSFTAGDLVYYASGTALSKLGIGSANYVMTSSGTAPQWTQYLGVASGGTGIGSGTSGGVLYFSATGTLASSSALAANSIVVGGGAGSAPSTITTGTGVVTALGVNTGTAGAFVVNGGDLGTPSSGTLTNATGLPIATGVSGLGTSVATALAVNVGTAGAFVVNGGALGTPSSGTLTNATGLPISTGVSGLGTSVATALAVNVGTAGAFVVNGGALGTPSSGTLTNATGLPISTGVSGLGTGVATALAANANGAGGFTTIDGAATLTNKRIDPRVSSAASASSVTPDVASFDMYAYTALAATLTINAPTGTPVNGDKLMFRILDNGTPRTLTWNATYTEIGATLPTSTTANKMVYVGCIYNAANTRWDVVAVATQA